MTNPTITFKTVKGACVELTAGYGVNAKVVGRADMAFSRVKLTKVSGLGLCVVMGPITAQICAEDIETVKEFFAAEDAASRQRAAEYLASDEHKADQFRAKFYARNSDY